jgi:hypothetical protein
MVVVQGCVLGQANRAAGILHELLAQRLPLVVQERCFGIRRHELHADLGSLRQGAGRLQHDDAPFDMPTIYHRSILLD